MLSNYQIANIAEDLKINLPIQNITMKDEFKTAKVGSYIINLQSTFQGNGSHWTGLIIDKNEAFFVIHSELHHRLKLFKLVRKTRA
jgi:hypothetical protein